MPVPGDENEVADQHAHGRHGGQGQARGEDDAGSGAKGMALAENHGEGAGGQQQDGVVVAGE